MASSINASTSGAGGLITTADNTGILNLQTAGTTGVTVDASQNVTVLGNTYLATSSGNVGIGTNSSSTKLQVDFSSANTTVASAPVLTLKNNSFTNNCVTGIVAQNSQGGNAAGIDFININQVTDGGGASGAISFWQNTGGTKRYGLTLGYDGQVSISNLSAYTAPEGVFTVNGNGCGDYIGAISNRNTSNCGPAHGLIIRAGYNGSSSASNFFSFRRPDNTVLGAITQNGASNVSYATSSDYRLKENITPMTDALAKISALKPVTYTWKEDGSAGQGFIAHELQEVVPNAVVGEKDAVDAEGNPQYQGVDTSFLVATLTAAIQEQQKIILDLKLRVENLETVK